MKLARRLAQESASLQDGHSHLASISRREFAPAAIRRPVQVQTLQVPSSRRSPSAALGTHASRRDDANTRLTSVPLVRSSYQWKTNSGSCQSDYDTKSTRIILHYMGATPTSTDVGANDGFATASIVQVRFQATDATAFSPSPSPSSSGHVTETATATVTTTASSTAARAAGGLSTGSKAGIGIGVLLAVLLLIAIGVGVVFFRRHERARSQESRAGTLSKAQSPGGADRTVVEMEGTTGRSVSLDEWRGPVVEVDGRGTRHLP